MTTIPGRAALFLGVVLLGCTAVPDRVVAPPDLRLDRVNAAGSGLQQRVTGHADILLPNFGNAEEKYSISAIRHADGTFSGEFELKSDQTGGLRNHGEILCFTIVGNIARLAGLVTQSDSPDFPAGGYMFWTIIDNGEGNDDPPDQTSDFIGPVTEAGARIHCNNGRNVGPIYPVLSGNLQVHE